MIERTTKSRSKLVASLATAEGEAWLRSADSMLGDDVRDSKFDSERAVKVYAVAIERSILATTSGSAGVTLVRSLRESGLVAKVASELVGRFRHSIAADTSAE